MIDLKSAYIETILGTMLAIADDEGLYLLEFIDRKGLDNELVKLRKKLNAAIVPRSSSIIKNITTEISNYFNKKKFIFKTPIHLMGTPFQTTVWQKLRQIPQGESRSYREIAHAINAPRAYRAVARANAANPLCIIVPCHRVINTSGELGGYSGGTSRKQWLLEHEGA